MKKIGSILLATVMLLTLVSPAAASAPTGMIGIYNVAACQDTTTVTVSGTASAATNRVKAWLYKQNDDGEWNVELAHTVTGEFDSGDFVIPIVFNYFSHSVDGGTPLQVVVKLQSRSGNSWVDVGSTSTIVNASDKSCQNKCSATINTIDRAPADGVITVRSHYGSFFRPEGWLHGAMPVKAGERAFFSVVALPCNWTVRAWYYPATGKDRTPRMLPAQYWPSEFGATTDDGAIPYTASFAKGIKATAPLEPGDPYAPK